MLKYKLFSVAFSYPDNGFFSFFPELLSKKEKLILEYDHIFRANEVWLYSSEYKAENEFQRAQALADINGFYAAFGLEINLDRPDSLVAELEFMHFLIFKQIDTNDAEKFSICQDAQKKFFNEHLYPAAKNIATTIISKSKNNFYQEVAGDLFEFLKSEARLLVG